MGASGALSQTPPWQEASWRSGWEVAGWEIHNKHLLPGDLPLHHCSKNHPCSSGFSVMVWYLSPVYALCFFAFISPSGTLETDADQWERACDTLLMCIVTVLNHGLRNGGGVGDILRKPSKDVSLGSTWGPLSSAKSCCVYCCAAALPPWEL